MKNLFYRIIYHPSINPALLTSVKGINSLLGKGYQLPPSGILPFRLPSGEQISLSTNQTCFLTKVIYWQGLDRFEYSTIFLDMAREIRSFLDIGANIGYYSMLTAAVNNQAQVLAFEPASGPLHYLKENVELNSFQNSITAVDLALSDQAGEIEFFEQANPKYSYLEHNLGGMSGSNPKFDKSAFTPKRVRTEKLDDFVVENRTKGIDLMKIDTEGSEHRILKGGSKTIEEHRPIIICETLYNKIEVELEEIMKAHGYLFFNHSGGKLVKVDTIIRKKDDGIRDCFFVPAEKEKLVNKYLQ